MISIRYKFKIYGDLDLRYRIAISTRWRFGFTLPYSYMYKIYEDLDLRYRIAICKRWRFGSTLPYSYL